MRTERSARLSPTPTFTSCGGELLVPDFGAVRRRARGEAGGIGDDRRRLGDDRITMLERRHFAHRVHREVIRPAVLALAQAQQMDVVRLTDLLQHPARDRGARWGGMIERKLRHAVLHY